MLTQIFSAENALMLEVLRNIATICALFIAIFGWFIVNAQANKREKRKEHKDAIIELDALSKELYELTTNYYHKNGHNPLVAARIKKVLIEIDNRLVYIKSLHKNTGTVSEANIRINHLVTGNSDFESPRKKKWDPCDERLIQLIGDLSILCNGARTSFSYYYHSGFFKKFGTTICTYATQNRLLVKVTLFLSTLVFKVKNLISKVFHMANQPVKIELKSMLLSLRKK